MTTSVKKQKTLTLPLKINYMLSGFILSCTYLPLTLYQKLYLVNNSNCKVFCHSHIERGEKVAICDMIGTQ